MSFCGMMTCGAPYQADTSIFRRLRRSEQVTFVYGWISLMLFDMNGTKISRAGFLLAGGKSSRMGVDKAFLDFGGRTLLDRALEAMSAVCERVTIVGDPAKFGASEGVRGTVVVGDIFQGCGPLGGIHSALVHSNAELNLVLAVDMPFVSEELLAFLFVAAETGDALVTVPSVGKGVQPLCAIYRRDFSRVAELAVRSGRYKIESAFSGVAVRVIDEAELVKAGFSERNFFNVNTPEDRLGL
jgi:molybdenum cofactor guanylyltransferase